MELKTQVKALNYTKKLLLGETDSILPWPYYPQKPAFDPQSRTLVPLPRSTPEAQGLSSGQLEEFLRRLAALPEACPQSVLVLRRGQIVLEAGFAPCSPQVWHVTHSLCKTVTGMAIGLLADEGKLELDQPLSDVFPEFFNLFTSRRTRSLTFRHLLTMTSGVNFREVGALLEKNWLRAYFESDHAFDPGTRFDYNSMNSYVLACAVQRLTGQSLMEFLTARLFNPLGFGPVAWEKCPMGVEKGGWGMYLMPEDMAKLGLLLLQKGAWKNADGSTSQILSPGWVEQMTTRQVETQGVADYGLHIWTLPQGGFTMNGMFGQYVYCLPQQELAVVLCESSPNLFSDSRVFSLLQGTFADKPLPDSLPADPSALEKLNWLTQRLQYQRPAPQPESPPPALPWYKALWRRLFGPKELPAPGPQSLPARAQELLAGKTFYAPDNHVGLLPLMAQCMQGNYGQGLRSLTFEAREGILRMLWQEGEGTFSIPLNFAAPQSCTLLLGQEQWMAAAMPVLTANEDDVPVLKITLCFPEHSSSRRIKLFLYDQQPLLRLEETPSLLDSMQQMSGNAQVDLFLDLFKDAGYARYRLNRFCSPELHLTETPPEALAPVE